MDGVRNRAGKNEVGHFRYISRAHERKCVTGVNEAFQQGCRGYSVWKEQPRLTNAAYHAFLPALTKRSRSVSVKESPCGCDFQNASGLAVWMEAFRRVPQFCSLYKVYGEQT
jgi:hypothetical protein